MQDDRDPDLNYFNEINIQNKETKYLNKVRIKIFLCESKRFENISILHINIRGLKTNFENFRNFVNNAGTFFDIICLTETWCSDSEINNNSCFNISNYNAIPFERKTNKRDGSILIYIKTDFRNKLDE